VPLTPKAFELLVLLVENRGHLLKKDELIERVWPNTFVEEANLAQNVSALRKALDDKNGGAQYIATVPKGGIALQLRWWITLRPRESSRLRLSSRALGLPRESPSDMYLPSWPPRPRLSHSRLHFRGAFSIGDGPVRPVSHGFNLWPCCLWKTSPVIRPRTTSPTLAGDAIRVLWHPTRTQASRRL
jgi:hypothetical protein